MLVDTSVFDPHTPASSFALYFRRSSHSAFARAGKSPIYSCANPDRIMDCGHAAARGKSLGMSANEAATELARIKGMFLFLSETPEIYPAWEALVIQHKVMGSPL